MNARRGSTPVHDQEPSVTRSSSDVGLGAFNAASEGELEPILLTCCSSRAWVGSMLAGRPYRGVLDVLEASEVAVAAMSESELDRALESHPRIGEPLTADSAESSRREQAGVSEAEDSVRRELVEGNRAYERRFGHVYLVSAAGRRAEQLLELLGERLTNDPATERTVLRRELATINRLRLERLLRA